MDRFGCSKVTALAAREAQWVTFLARNDPDTFETAPGATWQTARACIEAMTADEEAAADEQEPARRRRSALSGELQRQERRLAELAAETRWPGLAERSAALHVTADRVKADLAAGRNPFLDGTPYHDGGARAAKEARKGQRR